MKYFQLIIILLIILLIYLLLKCKNPLIQMIITPLTGFLALKTSHMELTGGKREPFKPQMKNIYGEPLQVCQKIKSDMSGSWDDKGYCSELGGGVHQICFDVKKTTQNFASDTYQGVNWSKGRLGKNHCMCLGAWALYKSRQKKGEIPKTNNELKCEAIPQVSLTKSNIDTWNTWNGNELPNQIVDGVNDLVKQCYHKAKTNKQKNYLKKKYLNLIRGRKEFTEHII
jgi:hypothetical protein